VIRTTGAVLKLVLLSLTTLKTKAKAVPQHAAKALEGRSIAPTHLDHGSR
jgi:hypothetical protein